MTFLSINTVYWVADVTTKTIHTFLFTIERLCFITECYEITETSVLFHEQLNVCAEFDSGSWRAVDFFFSQLETPDIDSLLSIIYIVNLYVI